MESALLCDVDLLRTMNRENNWLSGALGEVIRLFLGWSLLKIYNVSNWENEMLVLISLSQNVDVTSRPYYDVVELSWYDMAINQWALQILCSCFVNQTFKLPIIIF